MKLVKINSLSVKNMERDSVMLHCQPIISGVSIFSVVANCDLPIQKTMIWLLEFLVRQD